MKRFVVTFTILFCLALTFGHSVSAQKGGHQGTARLDLVEATVPDLLKALQTNLITSEQLVEMYLARIAAYDNAGPKLNAFLTLNPNALAEARALDAARHPGIARSPLYGIPVLLKDNVDTADMPTTAGSVALEGSIPPDDAFIAKRLRDAGAIILGKATLTEFANFLINGMPTGYSSLGGYGFNPHDPRELPAATAARAAHRRVELGSGIAVAANLVAVAVGTETSGSILSPASANTGCRHRRRWSISRDDHSDYRRSGHRRTDHADGDGCGHPARRAGGTRSIRPRDQRVPHTGKLLQ